MIFRHGDPHGEWTPTDFRLAEAYQQYKNELCPKCGQPIWLCRSTDNDVLWNVDTTVCYASKAIEERRWKDDNPKKQPSKEERSSWGKDYFPTAKLAPYSDRESLPSRTEYIDSLS